MAFRVRFSDNSTVEYAYGDSFRIENGVLVITFANPTQWDEYYAPHTWDQVTAQPPPEPGIY